MKKKNALYLECRGCYFWNDDPINNYSDVGNYRVCSTEYIPAKNGRAYFLEFTNYDRHEIRTTHKITGKPLKHPKIEITVKHALHLSTEFTNDRGSWGDISLEKTIHDKKLTYTKENILNVVNEISIKQYDEIIFIGSVKILPKINYIYNMGGYRERAIIDDLKQIKTKECTRDYWVLTFIDSNNNTFDFEYHSNRITG